MVRDPGFPHHFPAQHFGLVVDVSYAGHDIFDCFTCDRRHYVHHFFVAVLKVLYASLITPNTKIS